MTIEGLGEMKVSEIFVVSEVLHGEWGSMEVMLPGFQGTDDCEEFSVIDVIVLLSQREQLREIGAGVPFTVQVSL